MNRSAILVVLSALIAALALAATTAGLFWPTEGGSYPVTTLRGESADIYGRGLYFYDTVFKGAGSRGTDLVTLALGIPLLVAAALLYRRGSLRGHLLLVGTLGYVLYVYASLALSIAYNDLFLVYVALVSTSLFAFVLAFSSIDAQSLASRFQVERSRRGVGIFMLVSGLVTAFVWLDPLVRALIQREPPALLGPSTTMVTEVLDVGVIVPAAVLSGVLILRQNLLGYRIAFAMLVLEAMLAPMIVAQTIFQFAADVSFTTAEIVGPIAGFTTVALIAIWVETRLLREVSLEGSHVPVPHGAFAEKGGETERQRSRSSIAPLSRSRERLRPGRG